MLALYLVEVARLLEQDNVEAVETTHALLAEQPELVAAWRFYIEALRRDLGDEAARKRLSSALQEFPDVPEAQRTQILKIVLEGFAP